MWRYKAKSISDGLAYEAQQKAALQAPVSTVAYLAPALAPVPSPPAPQIQTVTVYKTITQPSPDTKALKDSIVALQQQNAILLQNQKKLEEDRVAQMAKMAETKENIENKLSLVLENQKQQQSSQDMEEKSSQENLQLQFQVEDLKQRLLEATSSLSAHSSSMNENAPSGLIPPSHDKDSLGLILSDSGSAASAASSPKSGSDDSSDYVKVGEPTPGPTPVNSPRGTPRKEGLT
jgi:hypothetical protein